MPKYDFNKVATKNTSGRLLLSCHLQQSLTPWQQPPKHFELQFFFMRSMAFIIFTRIFFNCRCNQFVRIHLLLKKCLFSWSYSYLVSTCCLEFFPFNFSSYLSKKYIFLPNRNVVSHIVITAFVGF